MNEKNGEVRMYRVVIWGTGSYYNRYLNLIKLYEGRGDYQVVGVFSDDSSIENCVDGFAFYKKDDISNVDFDFCIVAMNRFPEARTEASSLGIEISQLIPVEVFSIPYFDFAEYIRLKQSRLSIFASLCWGGICYKTFGLEALSPTNNLYFEHSGNEFVKFINNLEQYLAEPFELVQEDYQADGICFPLCRVGDIRLFCNHYRSFEEAKDAWERRKRRVNLDNLLIVHYTDSPEVAEKFSSLPYDNKIIFTTFDSEIECAFNLKRKQQINWLEFINLVNLVAFGQRSDIDLLKLLTHRKNYIRIH